MQLLASPRTYALVGLLALASVSFLRISPPAGTTTPILAIHPESLTTYLPSSATTIQDVQPQVGQRGTNLEGSFRAGPSQLMRINGNPFESVWRAPSVSGLRLDMGTFGVQDTDIALPAEGFSWVIGRSYNARQEDSGSSHRDSDGYQGKNWFQNSQPEILLYEHATDDAKDVVYLYYGADRFAEYQRFSESSDDFKGTNGAAGIIEYTAGSGGEPDTYKLTDQHGNALTFFGFDANASPADGQIWKIVDPAGNTAYVGDSSTASTAIANGFDSSGYITRAYDTSDRRYTYTYTTLNSVDRLTEVETETKTGGTWASPTGLETVAKVEYSYYADETYGDIGDLKLVEITTPMTDSGVEVVYKKYYRYWEGTFNDSTNPGHPHALKYVVGFEGTRRQDWEDSTFDEDFLTLSNSSLEPYAEAYFEYDSSHRVDKAWFNGECGCSGGVNGTHEFEYETNGSFSDDTGAYDNTWKTRTIVNQPDGTYMTQYWDEAHQPSPRSTPTPTPTTRAPRRVDGRPRSLGAPAPSSPRSERQPTRKATPTVRARSRARATQASSGSTAARAPAPRRTS